MMSAKDCVPAGGSPHESAGEMFLPLHVYFTGMDAPLANASLVRVSEFATIASVGSAGDEQAENKTVKVKRRIKICFILASISLLFDFSFVRRVPHFGYVAKKSASFATNYANFTNFF